MCIGVTYIRQEMVSGYRVPVKTLPTSAMAWILWVCAGTGDNPRLKQSVHIR